MGQRQNRELDIEPKSIVVFCSAGRHFDDAVCELKERFPRAKLTAVAPLWRTEQLSTSGFLDNVIAMTRNKLSLLGNFRECILLLAAIRAAKCDLFVTMYDSSALNLLHSLSASRNHAIFDARGKLYALGPAKFSLPRLILSSAWRFIVGRLTYVLIRTTLRAWGLFGKRR